MELNFPYRNWVINTFDGFTEPSSVFKFSQSKQSVEKFLNEDFDSKHYRDLIPNFENEIQQVIATTNQETIDFYFNSLADYLEILRDKLTEGFMTAAIEEWNQNRLAKFELEVEKKTDDYFKEENRKRLHLEVYETTSFPNLINFFKAEKVTKTNYNYLCIEDKLDYIEPKIVSEYLILLKDQFKHFSNVAKKYGVPWADGKIKANTEHPITLKTILFTEGEIDVDLIRRAMIILGREDLLEKLELRYRNGQSQLDKLWGLLTDNNWETLPQRKILLYDCDTGKPNEDFGHVHRRTLIKINENNIFKGIENLFPNETLAKAVAYKNSLVDIKKVSGTERGVQYEMTEYVINKQEKRNFANWAIEFGSEEDFVNFNLVFEILDELIS